MSDYGGLLKLLRASGRENGCNTTKVCVCTYMDDAADAIEGLRAEVAILKDAMYEASTTDMQRTLLWLADNVSEALATHICCTLYDIPHGHAVPSPMLDGMTDALIAALRAAAGSAAPEVK